MSVTALKQTHEHVEHRELTAAALANPLSGIPREQLFRDVEAFAHAKDLTEVRRYSWGSVGESRMS